jgi:hypothetical protein
MQLQLILSALSYFKTMTEEDKLESDKFEGAAGTGVNALRTEAILFKISLPLLQKESTKLVDAVMKT